MFWSLVIASALLLGVPATSTAMVDDTLDGITTLWPLETLGVTTASTDQGALRLEPGTALSGIALQADSVTVDMQWRRGAEIDPGGFPMRVNTERGSQTFTIHDALVGFSPFRGEPLIVPFAEDATANISLSSAQGFLFAADEDPTLAAVGESPDTVTAGGDGETFGFWYTQEGTTIQTKATGSSGSLRMHGSFSLFVNDLTIEASGSNMNWSQWTGHQDSGPRGPASESEKRVTVLHVKNGTFVASSIDDLRLFSPALTVDVEGIVSSTGVTGRLLQGREVFLFDDDPLRIQGTGSLPLGVEKNESSVSPRLVANAKGAFDVQGASKVERLPKGSDGLLSGPFSLLTGGSLLTAAIFATAALMGVGFLPLPLVAREHLYDRWMERGRDAREAKAWSRATGSFRRAIRMKVGTNMAWYELAQTELERGDGVRAEEIALEASKVPGMDPREILDLRTSAAWQRKDWPAFNAHMAALAESCPNLAVMLMSELNVDRAVLDEKTIEALARPELKGDLQGYA